MGISALNTVEGSETGCDSPSLSLRLSDENDRAFLFSVYSDSRYEELLNVTHWDQAEKTEFLQFQFNAQDTHYREHYPTAEYKIIQVVGADIGRLYIERTPGHIRIMDIAILRPYRRKGFARRLINEVLVEATKKGSRVSLHVEPDNVAKQLYLSLGFKVVGEISFYERMEWES